MLYACVVCSQEGLSPHKQIKRALEGRLFCVWQRGDVDIPKGAGRRSGSNHSFFCLLFLSFILLFDYVLHSFLITSFTFALSLIISFIVSSTPSFYFYFRYLCFLYSLFSFTLFASFIGYSLPPCPCFFHSFFSSTLSYVPFTLNLFFSSLFLVFLTCLSSLLLP